MIYYIVLYYHFTVSETLVKPDGKSLRDEVAKTT